MGADAYLVYSQTVRIDTLWSGLAKGGSSKVDGRRQSALPRVM